MTPSNHGGKLYDALARECSSTCPVFHERSFTRTKRLTGDRLHAQEKLLDLWIEIRQARSERFHPQGLYHSLASLEPGLSEVEQVNMVIFRGRRAPVYRKHIRAAPVPSFALYGWGDFVKHAVPEPYEDTAPLDDCAKLIKADYFWTGDWSSCSLCSMVEYS
ncbi:uncharacterized protein ARMOST_18964 [Armillaria ostoyae]|uniref:Uncharacterized protein n=1 Tax=Armillaria ostoyae TaxID=47428 RepID=A0A284S3A6_ARMOS|nr:uncharacterized protein ARMOST_18964 [Armillaria ostoyae]